MAARGIESGARDIGHDLEWIDDVDVLPEEVGYATAALAAPVGGDGGVRALRIDHDRRAGPGQQIGDDGAPFGGTPARDGEERPFILPADLPERVETGSAEKQCARLITVRPVIDGTSKAGPRK